MEWMTDCCTDNVTITCLLLLLRKGMVATGMECIEKKENKRIYCRIHMDKRNTI